MNDADRSSLQIAILLKNLDPTNASLKHKDRLRHLNKFRNYVTATPAPEFYDDDYPLLLLGNESPSNDEENECQYSGLMRAAGCPSTDHKDALKRTARPAISMLRYLCCEFDGSKGVMGELNGFASAFCALNVLQLRMVRLDVHVGKGDADGGSRGGSKDDACHLLALVFTRHTDTDQETPKPLLISDLLPSPECQNEFVTWLGLNVSSDVRMAIQNNCSDATGGAAVVSCASLFANAAATTMPSMQANEEEDDAFGKKKLTKKSSATDNGSRGVGYRSLSGGVATPVLDAAGKPTRWCDTQMASETRDRVGGTIFIEEEVSLYVCLIVF